MSMAHGDCLQGAGRHDVATGKIWYFAAECWLDAAQGYGAAAPLLLTSDKDPWADGTCPISPRVLVSCKAYKVRT
jgi:hypothetical protein